MALKPLFVLLLWALTLFIHGVTSLCDVVCSTDFDVSLNCSCSGSVPTYSVLIKVMCSDEGLDVHGSCEVKPPQSWCVMYPKQLDEVAAVETMCNTTASQELDDRVLMYASDPWALSDVVKALPPVDVHVTNTAGFYNVTWDHVNKIDTLTYRVRVRESKDLSKDPAHSILVGVKYILLDCEKLKPHVNYTVDVQAKMSPKNVYLGPWSEWSSTVEWRTRATSAEIEGINGRWWYFSMPVILVLLVLLGYSKKTWWQKKLQRILHIPKADEFFKPLDLNYGGNFKEWVKPVFSECDYVRINSHAQIISEKQHEVLQWNNEKQSYSEDNEMKQGGDFLLQPHSNSLLFFQDGGSSQGTGHSAGHVSIHTVTLSGEEEFEQEVMSQRSVNSFRSFQGGENYASFVEDNREHAGYDLEEPFRQSGILPQHENQISNNLSVENINFQPRAPLNEPERVSLASFASNEPSEDGYPHVDFDTIDSGFGECGSPGASDLKITEQMDSNLFHEHKSSNSNYVKQWMTCSSNEEDSSNSTNELHETQ
ncbi:interleukin 21 receptor, tandem duplicate 1 [Cottoperca gobio]|uniref:Interleukin-21 receptor-like n=1 Tax=Cottoperca gobio TaxID=56716 RepID=A0A6J2RBY6_COTGO|nr:interleukin-21 receptor-like [Cottoperca gobio]XP_029307632.1 interleukin-21 receptor-like [Cottoperca gobio]XP_029307635.1 interleukin-21 receptor-like [Cottoperca gobio]XP_029307636.1 interleukin-21 receptor-like [Cottoperca gobio]XP_029307637.1 interleukin-21 receptor-like [Cottoperca gobio]XP_029307638.1 interleukin-21 receptor-like [Cottoperca gobio]XP_029307639.1 interleukin-21 receptor-like [Cottoperca gobio]XP_029307640.1 interleukin-21 receptor-like [Cottoperca gobio]